MKKKYKTTEAQRLASKLYRERHKEQSAETQKKWREKNKEKVREMNRKSHEKFIEKNNWSKYCAECKRRRVEKLKKQGCINPWYVIGHGKEPKFESKDDDEQLDRIKKEGDINE